MKLIDIKSLLIGILGTALVMVLMGVAHKKGHYQLECGSQNYCAIMNTTNGQIRFLGYGLNGESNRWVETAISRGYKVEDEKEVLQNTEWVLMLGHEATH